MTEEEPTEGSDGGDSQAIIEHRLAMAEEKQRRRFPRYY